MRRLTKLATTSGILFSALICIATAILWVRSYWRADIAGFVLKGIGGGFNSLDGTLAVGFGGTRSDSRAYWYSTRADDYRDHWLRFLWIVRVVDGSLQFPHWMLVALTAIAPVIHFRRRGKKRKPTGLLCPQCGYDLRATPYRCPECGHTRPAPLTAPPKTLLQRSSRHNVGRGSPRR